MISRHPFRAPSTILPASVLAYVTRSYSSCHGNTGATTTPHIRRQRVTAEKRPRQLMSVLKSLSDWAKVYSGMDLYVWTVISGICATIVVWDVPWWWRDNVTCWFLLGIETVNGSVVWSPCSSYGICGVVVITWRYMAQEQVSCYFTVYLSVKARWRET